MNDLISPIGLKTEQSEKVAKELNELLASYQVFYMNIRGFHWNIQGDKFFELHTKFEELYTDLLIKVDEIAERVLTLSATPIHTYSDYLALTEIKESKNLSEGKEMISCLLDGFKTLLIKQRQLLEISDAANDEGTNALMSDYISEQEKLVWMYSSVLK